MAEWCGIWVQMWILSKQMAYGSRWQNGVALGCRCGILVHGGQMAGWSGIWVQMWDSGTWGTDGRIEWYMGADVDPENGM